MDTERPRADAAFPRRAPRTWLAAAGAVQ